MLPDLERAIMKLAGLSEERVHERIYVLRQVLDGVQRESFEAGYRAAMKDRANADVLAEQEARAALSERTETDA